MNNIVDSKLPIPGKNEEKLIHTTKSILLAKLKEELAKRNQNIHIDKNFDFCKIYLQNSRILMEKIQNCIENASNNHNSNLSLDKIHSSNSSRNSSRHNSSLIVNQHLSNGQSLKHEQKISFDNIIKDSDKRVINYSDLFSIIIDNIQGIKNIMKSLVNLNNTSENKSMNIKSDFPNEKYTINSENSCDFSEEMMLEESNTKNINVSSQNIERKISTNILQYKSSPSRNCLPCKEDILQEEATIVEFETMLTEEKIESNLIRRETFINNYNIEKQLSSIEKAHSKFKNSKYIIFLFLYFHRVSFNKEDDIIHITQENTNFTTNPTSQQIPTKSFSTLTPKAGEDRCIIF
jgi:hypothetical protein